MGLARRSLKRQTYLSNLDIHVFSPLISICINIRLSQLTNTKASNLIPSSKDKCKDAIVIPMAGNEKQDLMTRLHWER